jgi:hypothetical protein
MSTSSLRLTVSSLSQTTYRLNLPTSFSILNQRKPNPFEPLLKMKSIATIAALNTYVAMASAEYFGLISLRSGSPIHYQDLTASNQSLWLNKPTASFCPPSVEKIASCPAGNTTDFLGGTSTLGMGALVPGGQQVYIERETGAVKYTIAHSAAIPNDDIQTGWNLTEGDSFGYLANENGGFIACPASDCDKDSWQVFVALECLDFDDACLSFDVIASNTTKAAAWQYT